MISCTVTVVGMTCGHCAQVVTESVHGVDGVREVLADRASGRLMVVADGAVDEPAIEAAVAAAGYGLASSPTVAATAGVGS